jgi:putative MATE family efflux protein
VQVKTSYSDILRIAYPVVLGSISITILNVTDTIFLGRVGETELGAAGLGGVLYFVLAMIGVAIGMGAQILIARRSGEKNEGAIGEIFDHSFLILASLGIILFAFMEFLSPVLLRFLVRDDSTRTAVTEFLHYRSFGLIAVLCATAFRSFYVGIAQPKVYGVYSALMAIVNILLGWLFIFGNWGFPKMGIAGAGMASSISEWVALLFIVAYTTWRHDVKKFQLFRFSKFDFDEMKKILVLSAPLVVQNFISMGAWFVFFVFIEKMGKHELAISNLARSAYMVSMTPIWGFSIAANSMVSNIIGQKKSDEVMPLLKKILLLAVLTTLVMILINLFIPQVVLGMFTKDEILIRDSLGVLQMVNLAMIFFSAAIVCISAVSGTGATTTALIIEIAAIFIYMTYIYIMVFPMHCSLEIAWLAEAIYWIFTGLVCFIYLRSGRWKKIIL